jgi:penicillin-binding protein 1B
MAQDNTLLTSYGLEVEQRFEPELMFLLNHVLERVVREGTASSYHFPGNHTYSGKTGTSNDLRDSWFAGFSDTHMAAVWLGRDDNKPISLSGSSGALKVWGKVMETIGSSELEKTEPANITGARIDTETLEATSLPGGNTTVLPFISGTEPVSSWSAPAKHMQTIEHKAKSIWDSLNNLLN